MQLYNIISKILGVDGATLNDESNAQNTANWDSLRHIEVIFAVESAFHVRFTMPEIANLRKLGDIRNLLAAKNVKLDEQTATRVQEKRVA